MPLKRPEEGSNILKQIGTNLPPLDNMDLDVEMTNSADFAKPRGAHAASSLAIMFLNVRDGPGKMCKNYEL